MQAQPIPRPITLPALVCSLPCSVKAVYVDDRAQRRELAEKTGAKVGNAIVVRVGVK